MMRVSDHWQRVRSFMRRAGQLCSDFPFVPPSNTRLLRGELVFQEVCELLHSLGIRISINGKVIDPLELRQSIQFRMVNYDPDTPSEVIVASIADDCADISVTNIGTMISFGIQDVPILEAVDHHNLMKFHPDYFGGFDENGKLLKKMSMPKPDLHSFIREMSAHK